MHVLLPFLSVLAGLASLPGLAVANVVGHPRSLEQPPPPDRPPPRPVGWCCRPGCRQCDKSPACRPPGYNQCTDTFFGFTSCCMLDRKVAADGSEKLYTPITGHEVDFVTPGDVPVEPVTERAVEPATDLSTEPRSELLADPPAEHAAETSESPPGGWCCNLDCNICKARTHCLAMRECSSIRDSILGFPVACCKLKRKVAADGTEKLYAPISGQEVKLITSGDGIMA